MFLAMILACTVADAQSCQVYYNTEEVFVTEAACEADLAKALTSLSELKLYYVEPVCVVLPGESV
jgi:hypothetical protein